MSNKNKIILFIVVIAFIGIIVAKPFLKGDSAVNGGIDSNPNYAQAITEAKAAGQPVFLEFFGKS